MVDRVGDNGFDDADVIHHFCHVRETLAVTDRAYIIYSGEVLMEGRAQDIVNNPDVRRLYLGEEFRL